HGINIQSRPHTIFGGTLRRQNDEGVPLAVFVKSHRVAFVNVTGNRDPFYFPKVSRAISPLTNAMQENDYRIAGRLVVVVRCRKMLPESDFFTTIINVFFNLLGDQGKGQQHADKKQHISHKRSRLNSEKNEVVVS